MARLEERKENVILPDEARQRRNSGKRQHEDQHQHGRHGTAANQTVQIVEFVADQSLPAQH